MTHQRIETSARSQHATEIGAVPGAWSHAVGDSIDGKRLTHEFEPTPYARRWLAHDTRRGTDCLVYVFDRVGDARLGRLWRYLESTVGTRRAHTLLIESAGRERGGLVWASAPYPGNHTTLVTLESLRHSKGGQFTVYEVARSVEQLLEVVAASHASGFQHGPFSGEDVLVSPRGTLLVEMYGLSLALGDEVVATEDARRDEVRSVAETAWRLLTGTDPNDREIFEPQAKRSLDTAWVRWISHALDPAVGFTDADEAMARLPSRGGVELHVPAGRARGWLDRFSSALAPRRQEEQRTARKNDKVGGVG